MCHHHIHNSEQHAFLSPWKLSEQKCYVFYIQDEQHLIILLAQYF